ncbi:hypothetical protein CALVIDRAFT_535907 [Calocera viscosa TUFC12733]|uniref:C2H2-type domain-containing protein n=1 Tax=Calocera viscosa (strain TUFC12733) TaxID=1330018 RepID=A0A167NKI8_CALVF|nr:hypothetical protein CALVIDRAFT_535907 [Calocera viscosa TUFC12733]
MCAPGDPATKYECRLCGSNYSRLEYLKRHERKREHLPCSESVMYAHRTQTRTSARSSAPNAQRSLHAGRSPFSRGELS